TCFLGHALSLGHVHRHYACNYPRRAELSGLCRHNRRPRNPPRENEVPVTSCRLWLKNNIFRSVRNRLRCDSLGSIVYCTLCPHVSNVRPTGIRLILPALPPAPAPMPEGTAIPTLWVRVLTPAFSVASSLALLPPKLLFWPRNVMQCHCRPNRLRQ